METGPPQPRTGRLLRQVAYWAAIGLAIAGITHLVTVLALPRHSPDDAYARLARLRPGAPLAGALPDQDPTLANAFCLYDLSTGPLQVSLAVADADFATLSVYSRTGQVLYGLTSRSASQDRLALTIMTPAQTAARPRAGDSPAEARVRVETEERRGIVLAQALAVEPSAMGHAQAVASSLACGPDAAKVPALPQQDVKDGAAG